MLRAKKQRSALLTGTEAEPTTQTNKSVLTTLNTLPAPPSERSFIWLSDWWLLGKMFFASCWALVGCSIDFFLQIPDKVSDSSSPVPPSQNHFWPYFSSNSSSVFVFVHETRPNFSSSFLF